MTLKIGQIIEWWQSMCKNKFWKIRIDFHGDVKKNLKNIIETQMINNQEVTRNDDPLATPVVGGSNLFTGNVQQIRVPAVVLPQSVTF